MAPRTVLETCQELKKTIYIGLKWLEAEKFLKATLPYKMHVKK